MRMKYKEDEEYKERHKRQCRERYQKKKMEKLKW